MRFLADCWTRGTFYDDFECMGDLIHDNKVNQEWLFRVYCELFANLELIGHVNDYNIKFQLYIASIEKMLYRIEDDIDSGIKDKVQDAEKILGFFFSFLQVKSCWWMFDHYFVEDGNKNMLFYRLFCRVRSLPGVIITAANVVDCDGHSCCQISPN